MTDSTVIIGAGIAGVSAAASLRSTGYDGEIVLLGDEPELPYRRPPVSKEIVRGEKTADEIRIKKPQWYDDQSITLRTGTTAVAIDTEARAVLLQDSERLPYRQLLIATGGRARTWRESGSQVHTLRSLEDVPRLQVELERAGRVVVVGAGLIGSEIAASARGLGCEVVLLETASLPLPRLLPPELGQMYVDLHKGHGTELHTGVTVTSITEEGSETVVTSEDGRSWSASVVVLAVGMVPDIALAEQAGIVLAGAHDGGGIAVDAHGRTSAPGVFAAGDVANMPNRVLGGRHRVEHWQGAQNHGTAVGKNMAGVDEPFVEVPWCWSDQYGHTLQVAGWPLATHDLVVRGSLADLDFSAFLLEGDVVRGAVSMARPRDVRAARAWIADAARVDRATLADESADLSSSVLP